MRSRDVQTDARAEAQTIARTLSPAFRPLIKQDTTLQSFQWTAQVVAHCNVLYGILSSSAELGFISDPAQGNALTARTLDAFPLGQVPFRSQPAEGYLHLASGDCDRGPRELQKFRLTHWVPSPL